MVIRAWCNYRNLPTCYMTDLMLIFTRLNTPLSDEFFECRPHRAATKAVLPLRCEMRTSIWRTRTTPTHVPTAHSNMITAQPNDCHFTIQPHQSALSHHQADSTDSAQA